MKFENPVIFSFSFLCYQNDVGSLNHPDAHGQKNKEDLKITRTEWIKNKLRKNQIRVFVASVVSVTTCIGLIIGLHYGSYGFYKHTIHIFIVTDIPQLI